MVDPVRLDPVQTIINVSWSDPEPPVDDEEYALQGAVVVSQRSTNDTEACAPPTVGSGEPGYESQFVTFHRFSTLKRNGPVTLLGLGSTPDLTGVLSDWPTFPTDAGTSTQSNRTYSDFEHTASGLTRQTSVGGLTLVATRQAREVGALVCKATVIPGVNFTSWIPGDYADMHVAALDFSETYVMVDDRRFEPSRLAINVDGINATLFFREAVTG